MPYYHVRINELDEVYELDLARETLLRYIVEPYLKNEEFFCDGTRIDPSEIEKIKISETEKPSKELIPEARPKYTPIPGLFGRLSDQEIIMKEGMDVTRQFITHLPKITKQKSRTRSTVKVTREGLFLAGQHYDAICWVMDIISNVQKKIVIIDRYFNEKTLDLLCAKNKQVKVEVLTEKISPPLKVKAAEFNKQYGLLEIRLSSAFHDRFIIVDDSDFYHLGASIDHLGRRGFMFSRIEEPIIIQSLSNEITQEWKNAKIEIQP